MKSYGEILELAGANEKGIARCKAHDDKTPSLSISQGDDGRILLHCHAGCKPEDIVASLGLDWQDVLPPREKKREARTIWEIRDTEGNLVAEHVRFEEGGKKRFIWRRNGENNLGGFPLAQLPLYRAHMAPNFDASKAFVVCEGEKAADAAAKLGLQAVGTACGASVTPSPDSLLPLVGKSVILWPDFDEPGLEHMKRIAEHLQGVAKSVRWLHQPRAKAKDDAADFRGTVEELRVSVQSYPPEISGPLVMVADRVDSAIRALNRLHVGDFSDFIPTGIPGLDHKLGGGFQRGQVVLIGAPTGAGKTTLVVQFAMEAQKRGLALLISPEMSTEELVTREIVRISGKPKWHRAPWMSQRLREEAQQEHDIAATWLKAHPPTVAVYDSIDAKLDDVQRVAEERHKRSPLSFIALDYAQQLADADSDKARHLLVGEVGHRAVEMAREFHCPVIVTSQVNVFKDGREKDYSFRESQILEHKAHLVLLFLVERDAMGKVSSATFKARKARDLALFELEVDFEPSIFTIREKTNDVIVKDYTDTSERQLGYGLD